MNSIELSDEELQMIESMGANGFTPAEIAEVLEINRPSFEHYFSDHDGQIYKRYRKGYLQAQLTLRERIMKDAKNGSSPAQTLMKKIFDDADHYLKQL
jgi:AcrR family transcriptional regulator